jgi:hypothetical protein
VWTGAVVGKVGTPTVAVRTVHLDEITVESHKVMGMDSQELVAYMIIGRQAMGVASVSRN